MAVAFVASAGYSQISCTIPAGASVGQTAVLWGFSTNGSIATPAGWTSLGTPDNNNFHGLLAYKVLVAGDPGSSVSIGGTGNRFVGVVVYSGVTSISGSTVAGSTNQTSITVPSQTFQSGGMILGVAALFSNQTITSPSGWTNVINSSALSGSLAGDIASIASTTSNFTFSVGTSGLWVGGSILMTGASAPTAPTLTSPPNAVYTDVSSGVNLVGTYNSTDGANQNAYACRVKVSGAGSYNYWNSSTNALQSTLVWNAISTAPGASFSVSLPSSAVADGNTYNWSLASQEALGGLQSPFAADFTFSGQAAPALTVNGPSGVVTTANPLIGWTTTPPAGVSQTAYEVIVEHGAFGTVPGSGARDWDSGVVASTAQSVTVGVNLTNGMSYRAFVQVTESGGQVSGWKYCNFTVTFDMPATPGISTSSGTDPVTGAPIISVTVQGNDNLLTLVDASFESGLGTWAAGANTTAADSMSQAEDGSYSMSLTATATGTITAKTGTGVYAVNVGTTYSAIASFKAGATGRAATVGLAWYTPGGVLISTATSTSVNDTTSGWTQATITAQAPATAAFAAIVVTVSGCAASEVHYVDEAGLFLGAWAIWSRGGLVGTTQVTVTRSDGYILRYGQNLAVPPSNQQTVIVDYEAQPGVSYTYTAQITAALGGGTTVSSPVSASSNAAQITVTGWWLVDPVQPSTSIPLNVVGFPTSIHEQLSTHYPIGQQYPTIVADVVNGTDGQLAVETQSASEWQSLLAASTSQRIKWLMSPYGDGLYVRIGGASPTMGIAGQVHQTQLSPSTPTTPYRQVTLQYVNVGRP